MTWHFPDLIFKCIFLNENQYIFFSNFTEVCSEGLIEKMEILVQVNAWQQAEEKPLIAEVFINFQNI